jgi:hypothetical protein
LRQIDNYDDENLMRDRASDSSPSGYPQRANTNLKQRKNRDKNCGGSALFRREVLLYTQKKSKLRGPEADNINFFPAGVFFYENEGFFPEGAKT